VNSGRDFADPQAVCSVIQGSCISRILRWVVRSQHNWACRCLYSALNCVVE